MHVMSQSVCWRLRARGLVQSVPLAFLPLEGSVKQVGNFCHIFQSYWETETKTTKVALPDETGKPAFSLLEGLVTGV